ncbi:MAG: S8 family peptidase [Chitinophagales bacterium]|nr:S8 family peptidase [Chitinophagales bacterium]
MAKNKLTFCLLFLISSIYGREDFTYLIYFQDKPTCSPVKDSILFNRDGYERRKENISAFNQYDCPVNEEYVKAIVHAGFTIHGRSKWLNAIAVKTEDTSRLKILDNFDFIKEIQFLSIHATSDNSEEQHSESIPTPNEHFRSKYGYSYEQINCEKGIYLHDKGFKGQGIKIAIIDGGFSGADTIKTFKSLFKTGMISDVYDFVENTRYPFHTISHGTEVFSTMATNIEGKFIGTAPEATYCLFRTEDTHSEQLIEEFNLVRALEYADSIGVQLVNISLGYNDYDNEEQSYQWQELTSQHSIAVRGINIADEKGILVVVSAGNDGDTPWKYIAFPGNAVGALTVGAVDEDKQLAEFSSLGYPEMTTIKPDICAMGTRVATVDDMNMISRNDGTSYAAPITTGLIACLWSAYPTLKAYQIKDVVKKSASLYRTPNLSYGYGIPNFENAFWLLSSLKNGAVDLSLTEYFVYPKYFSDRLLVMIPENMQDDCIEVSFFDTWGRCISKESDCTGAEFTISIEGDFLPALQTGSYFIKVSGAKSTIVQRLFKN